jgi:hypothetical protein
MIFFRNVTAILGIALLAICIGCGWSTPASRSNTRTGVSESGYPKGQPADAGSPALATMKRPEKEKKAAETK